MDDYPQGTRFSLEPRLSDKIIDAAFGPRRREMSPSIDEADSAEALARIAQMQSLRDKAAAAETPEDIRAAIDELEAKAAEAERYADALERKRREIAAQPPVFLGNRKERRRSEALWRQKKRRGA